MSFRRLRLVLPAVLVFGLAGSLPAATPTDDGVPLDIDIRSKVAEKWSGMRKLATVSHGKLYGIAAVNEVPSPAPLLVPVDRARLAAHLRAGLKAQGFREIAAGEKPEIVLTVTYGRGFLHNPHLADAMIDELTPGIPTLTMNSPKQAMRQRGFAAEEKLQRAQFEKLYLTVSAWEFPEKQGAKPNLYWRTVMVVDNPDGRDLNLAMPAMLEAGVRWFDRDTEEGEVTINSTMPAGTVKLAPLQVIELGKASK